jgi:hypothetical protein
MVFINFKSIKEALSQSISEHFWISYRDGSYETGDKRSFYSKLQSKDELTFDISNNKVLANIGINGTIKYITFYRSSYRADIIPGVWVRKDFSKTGPYSFSVKLDGVTHDLSKVDWPFKTSLLDNIFPITELVGKEINVKLITCPPISKDGKKRLRGLIYGILIENTSETKTNGSIILPKISLNTSGPYLESNPDVHIIAADFYLKDKEIPFSLNPGENIWVPVVIQAPGESAFSQINEEGSLSWLNSTWSYYKNISGKLSMPNDKFTEEFFQRAICQCLGSIGMDQNEKIAGSNWGTYPTTENIWMKDMYYSYLPFFMLEPEFFKEGILWFLEYSIRPKGNLFDGGIGHSLSNSLTPIIMAGLYYTSTGDKEFFLKNKDIKEKAINILNDLITLRENKDIWLFPSIWLSDGYSFGDFHTGSNLMAWYCFKAIARILEEIYEERDLAKEYLLISGKIKDDINKNNVISGPFGSQYIEGVNDTLKKDRVKVNKEEHKLNLGRNGLQYIDYINSTEIEPIMVHDGEETDTTLMPLYGFLEYDDSCYKNYTHFAVSKYNGFYIPETKGILWEDYTEATFPGYITGFANVIDNETMNGENGHMTEIRRLTDIDGSIWWWPYSLDSKYGEVFRNNFCGKCAWGSGVFLGLFISQILGIKYDAPSRTLNLRPFSPSSNFSWEDFKIGESVFSVSFKMELEAIFISVENKNNYEVNLNIEIILQNSLKVVNILENDKKPMTDLQKGRFLNNDTAKITLLLLPGELKKISL